MEVRAYTDDFTEGNSLYTRMADDLLSGACSQSSRPDERVWLASTSRARSHSIQHVYDCRIRRFLGYAREKEEVQHFGGSDSLHSKNACDHSQCIGDFWFYNCVYSNWFFSLGVVNTASDSSLYHNGDINFCIGVIILYSGWSRVWIVGN